MAQVLTGTHLPTAAITPEIRRIGIADLRLAVSRGIDDFLAAPTQIAFLCVIYPLVGFAAARLAVNGALMPLIYPAIAGLSLLGPLTAIGLYEISRRREAGAQATWRDAFRALNAPGAPGIAALGLALLLLFIAWIGAARLVFLNAFGTLRMSPSDFLGALATPEGLRMILIGHAVGLVFAIIALAVTVVSFPMMLDRAVDARTAVTTSVRAVAANPVMMAVWGLFVAFTLAAGTLPLFVGLAIVMPVLGHSTWHLYRRLVV
ncbi:DUF2189 domain-containing protein [Elioraea sp.]|uniref:DUF2189 domain-containing protein n=1 Tax=Elioraea sp. TaxID=2185103 RepID=UPI0025C41B9E|nr:DUF2189 domain-containing protein [Elioraea sp.]